MSWRTRAALEGLGLRADSHRSRQLTSEDLADADLVIAMAVEHVEYIRRVEPGAAGRTGTLRRLARDLPAAHPGSSASASRRFACTKSQLGAVGRHRRSR